MESDSVLALFKFGKREHIDQFVHEGYIYTPYVKSKFDKTGIFSKIKVITPIKGEYSHGKYINS